MPATRNCLTGSVQIATPSIRNCPIQLMRPPSGPPALTNGSRHSNQTALTVQLAKLRCRRVFVVVVALLLSSLLQYSTACMHFDSHLYIYMYIYPQPFLHSFLLFDLYSHGLLIPGSGFPGSDLYALLVCDSARHCCCAPMHLAQQRGVEGRDQDLC